MSFHLKLAACLVALAVAGLPATIEAQEAEPLTRSDLLGVWEGLDSEGAELYWLIDTADDGSEAIELTATVTQDGARGERLATYEVRSIGADIAQLITGGNAEPALARRLVPDGIRVTWPTGRHALLFRVAEAVPSRALMFAASAEFTDEVQAGLLRLDGRWAHPAGEIIEVQVLDTARGLVTWTQPGTPEQLRLTMAGDDGWHFERPDGAVVTLDVHDRGLTMRFGDDEPTSLQRVR